MIFTLPEVTSSSLLYFTFFHSLSLLFTHFSSFLGASSARPVRWIVDQVCTEVRRLRERAERSQVYTNTPKKRFVIRIFGAYFVTLRNAEIIYLQSIPEIDPSSGKVNLYEIQQMLESCLRCNRTLFHEGT